MSESSLETETFSDEKLGADSVAIVSIPVSKSDRILGTHFILGFDDAADFEFFLAGASTGSASFMAMGGTQARFGAGAETAQQD